jgi:hypothetical protein
MGLRHGRLKVLRLATRDWTVPDRVRWRKNARRSLRLYDEAADEAEYDEWWGNLTDEEEANLKTSEFVIEALGFDPDTDEEFQEMMKEAQLSSGA